MPLGVQGYTNTFPLTAILPTFDGWKQSASFSGFIVL